jgi:hypothetical protein
LIPRPRPRRLALLAPLALLLAGAGCGGRVDPSFDLGPPSPQLDEVHERYEASDYTGKEQRANSQVLIDLDLREVDEVSLRARLLAGSDTLIDWQLTSADYSLEPGVDAASAVLVLRGLFPTLAKGVSEEDLSAITELRLELRQVTLLSLQATFPEASASLPGGLPVPFPLATRALSLERDLVVR